MARGWRLDCLAGYADELHESLPFRQNAGDLSAAGGARGDSGRLATQASLTGSLFHGGGLEEKGYDLNHILDQALRWHVSSVNIKSARFRLNGKVSLRVFRRR